MGKFIKGSKCKVVKHEVGIKQSQFVNISANCSIIKDDLIINVDGIVKQSHLLGERISNIIRVSGISLVVASIAIVAYIILAHRILKKIYEDIREYLRANFF